MLYEYFLSPSSLHPRFTRYLTFFLTILPVQPCFFSLLSTTPWPPPSCLHRWELSSSNTVHLFLQPDFPLCFSFSGLRKPSHFYAPVFIFCFYVFASVSICLLLLYLPISNQQCFFFFFLLSIWLGGWCWLRLTNVLAADKPQRWSWVMWAKCPTICAPAISSIFSTSDFGRKSN